MLLDGGARHDVVAEDGRAVLPGTPKPMRSEPFLTLEPYSVDPRDLPFRMLKPMRSTVSKPMGSTVPHP